MDKAVKIIGPAILRPNSAERNSLDIVTESCGGTHGEAAQRIAEIGLGWLKLLLDKNHDYGASAWNSPVLAPGMDPGAAILVRMSDKIARIQSLLNRPAKVTDESLRDTVADLGAYCLLWLARPEKDESEVNSQTA